MPCHHEWPGDVCSGNGICRLPDALLNWNYSDITMAAPVIVPNDYYCECNSGWTGATDFLYREGSDCTEHIILFNIVYTLIFVASLMLFMVSMYSLLTYDVPPLPFPRRHNGCCYNGPCHISHHPWRLRVCVSLIALTAAMTGALRAFADQRIGGHWGVTIAWAATTVAILMTSTDTMWNSARLDLTLLSTSAQHAHERMLMFQRMIWGVRTAGVLFIIANSAVFAMIEYQERQFELLMICLSFGGTSIGILGGFLAQYLGSLHTMLMRHRRDHSTRGAAAASHHEIAPLLKRLKFTRFVTSQLAIGAPLIYGIFAAWGYLRIKVAWMVTQLFTINTLSESYI
jgi:hypothetical protein